MPNNKEYVTLPAICIRNNDIIPLPYNKVRFDIGREDSVMALRESEKQYNKYILFIISKNNLIENPTKEDIEEYGLLAQAKLKFTLPNNTFKTKFDIISRVKIIEFEKTEPYFLVKYQKVDNIFDEQTLTYVNLVLKELSNNPEIYNENVTISDLSVERPPEVLADIIANNIKDIENRYRYVKELNVKNRLKFILEDIAYAKMREELETKINQEVKKSIDESQKNYYLRERMKAIQNELGDAAAKETEIEELREQIINAKMPEKIEEKALNELNRYSKTSPIMAESGIIKTYLDFLIALPWYKRSKDRQDVKKVEEILDSNHFGLEKPKERILEYLSVQLYSKKTPQAILCLVGPPGVGKTSLAISIAKALDRKFVKISLGGVRDEAEIRGHRRTYVGALPGRVLKGMADAKVVNPVFLIDEIDKMDSGFRGDPASAMLEVLDPEQNAHFKDHYLEEEYDLSQVLFITTANYLQDIPEPLRDRMDIVELNSYTEQEKLNIAKHYLVKENLLKHGITSEEFTINDAAIMHIIRHFTRESGVRELSRIIGSLIRKTIKKILEKKVTKVRITKANVNKYLSKDKYLHNLADKEDTVGSVTGLAYTQYGGDTLEIEVNYFKGKGNLVITGNLGDVMKESAMTALSFIKSQASKLNIKEEIFVENDFHIHVPEGAIPKDGPSAGITIATAIYSAVTGKKVKHNVGMTGEITLRGKILPIGGLKEKSIAAVRSGLTKILVPKENTRDLDEIPKEVKKKLEILPVTTFKEVIENTIC